MSGHDRINEAFDVWLQRFEVTLGVTVAQLIETEWLEAKHKTERSPSLVFAAHVALTKHNYDAAGDYFAQALKLNAGRASHMHGYTPLLVCFSAEELAAMTIAAPDTATLANQLTTALRAYGEELLKDEPLPLVTASFRDMTEPYTAVSLFQTCLLALHQQLPHLSLLDLHHLCYFLDAMHVELYGVSLFGTPTRVETGVSYLQELPYSVHRLLQAVATHFAGATSRGIQEIVQQEAAVKAAEMHGEVFFTCMESERLVASETVKKLLKMRVSEEDIRLETFGHGTWLSASPPPMPQADDMKAVEQPPSGLGKQLEAARELLAKLRVDAADLPLLAGAQNLLGDLQKQLDSLWSISDDTPLAKEQ